jgi:hypothetical protein
MAHTASPGEAVGLDAADEYEFQRNARNEPSEWEKYNETERRVELTASENETEPSQALRIAFLKTFIAHVSFLLLSLDHHKYKNKTQSSRALSGLLCRRCRADLTCTEAQPASRAKPTPTVNSSSELSTLSKRLVRGQSILLRWS